MHKCFAALLCGVFFAFPARAESDRNFVTTLPSGVGLHNNCYPQSQLPWGSCETNRGEGVNRGRSNGPSVNNDLPGTPDTPNVPGGPPIAGGGGGGGGPIVGGGGGGTPTPGCTNCPPGGGGGGGGGLGNPGNDKGVGRAGEDPNGKGKGPTGRRGRNN